MPRIPLDTDKVIADMARTAYDEHVCDSGDDLTVAARIMLRVALNAIADDYGDNNSISEYIANDLRQKASEL